MRPLFLVAALVLLAGCGKKPPAPAPAQQDEEKPKTDPPAASPSERDKLLTTLKTKGGAAQQKAADDLATLADRDPAVLDALVELLRDPKTAGPGQTHPTRIGSVREAAVVALLRAGPKGEAALQEKGLPVLRDGLSDKDAAVREHTAFTVGRVGPPAKPLAAWLQKLCADPDAKVSGVAFDAVQSVGVADPVGFVGLLTNENPDVRRRAADIVALLPEVPGDAVYTLVRALDDEDKSVRFAAGMAIATARGKGATEAAAAKLAEAVRKSYPATFDPDTAVLDGPEFVFWRALAGMGKVAAKPTAELLGHTNPLVRLLAARTLGEIGPDAKDAADVLKKVLLDENANVALEAGAALVRIGEKTDEVDALVKAALGSLNPGVAAAAVDAVARFGPAGKPHWPAVLGQLASPLPDARYAAVEFVGTLEPGERVKHLADVAKLATDEQPLIRMRVAAVLENLGPLASPAAAAVGAALAAEQEDGPREAFVAALAAMGAGAKPAVGGLLPLASDKDLSVLLRRKVIAAVVVADPASADVAAELVKVGSTDGDETVRSAAAVGLGKLNPLPPEAVEFLRKMARTDRRADCRIAAVRGLADAGPRARAARPDLDALAKDKLPALELWAKVALRALDGDVTKAGGVVREALAGRNAFARAAAADALLLVGPTPADVPALLKVLKNDGPGEKVGAVRAVGLIGPAAKDAVPRLAELLGDRDTDVRVAAAEALARMGSAALPAVPRLREVRSDPSAGVAARKALDRLGIPDERPRE